MIRFLIGLVVGAAFLTLVTKTRQRQMLAQLADAIREGETRLATLKPGSKEHSEVVDRLAVLRQAATGRLPMDSRQRLRVAVSILPSLALLVILLVVWARTDMSGGSYVALGLGVGALGAQIGLRVQTLAWRPTPGHDEPV